MRKLQEFIEDNLTGILGTVLFHLVLIVVFLGIKIHTIKMHDNQAIEISFQELPEDYVSPNEKMKEEFLKEDDELPVEQRSNIAVNTAKKVSEEISTEKYIEKLKQDLNIEDYTPPDLSDEAILPKQNETTKTESRNSDKLEYGGKTNITYYLNNRDKRYLPVPVYRCEGGGKVTIAIIVDRKGLVTSADIQSVIESSDPDCLAQAALTAARKSRFNADFNAEERQSGTITYHFVAQ